MPGVLVFFDREDAALVEDQILFAVQLDFGAAVLGVNDEIALFDANFGLFAAIENAAGSDGANRPVGRVPRAAESGGTARPKTRAGRSRRFTPLILRGNRRDIRGR